MEVILPHDTATERSVLGTMIRYNEHFRQNSDILSPNMFYDNICKAVFIAARAIINAGGVTDINALYNSISAHTPKEEEPISREDVLKIITSVNEHALSQDIDRLHRMAAQRSLWEYFTRAAQNIVQPLADVDEEIDNLRQQVESVQKQSSNVDATDFSTALDQLWQTIVDNRQGTRSSLISGFELFDSHYLFRPDTMTVIAAFTSVGKSALAMNVAVNIASHGDAVAVYSLEMGCVELAARIVSSEAQISSSVLLNKQLYDNQLASFSEATERLRRLPIYFDDDASITFERTLRSMRTMKQTKDIKLAIIDYLQIYAQNEDSTESSLSAMARAAKNIAKELHIAVICISQLNRSAPHPSIRMLRGSGQIEESADNVVLIDRPEAYPDNPVPYEGDYASSPTNGTAKFILAKGRGVGTGTALVNFVPQYTMFKDIGATAQTIRQPIQRQDNLPF